MRNSKSSWILWWLLFCVMACMHSLWTPPFQYPDESTHIASILSSSNPFIREQLEGQIINTMVKYRFWERAGAESPVTVPSKFYQAPLLRQVPTQFSKPRFYYRTAGKLVRVLHFTRILNTLYLLRFFGLCMTGLAVLFMGLICRELLPDSPWQTVAFSAAATPQFIWMAGAVNPTNLSWLSGALLFYGALQLLKPQKRILGWLISTVGVLLVILTHRSALALFPVVLIAALSGRHCLPKHRIPAWFWPLVGAATSLGTLLITWLHPLLIRMVVTRLVTTILQLRVSPVSLAGDLDWWSEFWGFFGRSLVLNFGWLSLPGPAWIYWLFAGLACAGCAGWMVSLFTLKRPCVLKDSWHGVLLWVAVLVMLWAAAGQFFIQGNLSQGRYLFAAWPAVACLITSGLSCLIPRKFHKYVVLSLLVLIWGTSVWSLWMVNVQGFYF